jgi:hypothetical protein
VTNLSKLRSPKSSSITLQPAIVSCDQFVTLLRFLSVYNSCLKFKVLFPLNMAPLQPLKDFKFHKFFFHIESNNVASSSTNQTPILAPTIEPISDANLWIFVEKTKRKRKEYEQNTV